MIRKLISGGQTGVDRAALDVALELKIECGGWCPRGRRAEEGTIPERYPLRETATSAYPERTEKNVCDSDGTLILTRGVPDRGTGLTYRLARRHKKPVRVVDLNKRASIKAVRDWIARHHITALNVAGPRESSKRGIGDQARRFLSQLLSSS